MSKTRQGFNKFSTGKNNMYIYFDERHTDPTLWLHALYVNMLLFTLSKTPKYSTDTPGPN